MRKITLANRAESVKLEGMDITVTRTQYIAIIERAIREAQDRKEESLRLWDSSAAALREHAKVATRVARADFIRIDPETGDVCGCPATQAGLWTDQGREPGTSGFAFVFDDLTFELAEPDADDADYEYVEILDDDDH